MNRKHPNWTAKTYRSRDEAFGDSDCYATVKELDARNRSNSDDHPLWWFLSICLLIALVLLCFTFPNTAKAQTAVRYGSEAADIRYLAESVRRSQKSPQNAFVVYSYRITIDFDNGPLTPAEEKEVLRRPTDDLKGYNATGCPGVMCGLNSSGRGPNPYTVDGF